MVAVATANADMRVHAVVASNCPARVADFLMTPWRRALFAIAKACSRLYPLRVSVNHFYGYEDLIDDCKLVERIAHDELVARARRLSVSAYRALLDDWDGAREVARLTRPLLLVQGTHDRLQPPEQTDQLFEAAQQGTVRARLDTGHLPALERPDLLADAVIAWLSSLGVRGRPAGP